MKSLGSSSRLYLLQLIGERGPLTLDQLQNARPENGLSAEVEIGRGATVKDYIDVMVKEGVLAQCAEDRIQLSDLGESLVSRLARDDVKHAVQATPPL